MFCGNCGRQISDNSPFCIYCGYRTATQNRAPEVESKPVDDNPGQPNPWKKIVIGLATVAGALVLALGYMMLFSQTATYQAFDTEKIVAEESVHYVNNELIVTAKENTKRGTVKRLVKEEGGEIVGYIPDAEKYQIALKDDTSFEDLKDIAESLSDNSEIEDAQIHYVYTASQNSSEKMNDPWENSESDKQEELEWSIKNAKGNNWWAEAIGMQSVWSMNRKYKSVKIGICDALFDGENKDIQSAISKIWNNPADNDDRDSVVDMYQEYAALSEEEQKAYKGYNIGHGTHLAGIIGAKGDNDFGIAGIMPNARLYCYSLSSASDQAQEKWIDSFELQYSIARMIDKKVRIINLPLSFSKLSTDAENGDEAALEELQMLQNDYEMFFRRLLKSGKDFLIVKSAGNSVDTSVNPRDAKFDFIGGIETENIRKHILVVGATSNHETYFTRSDLSYSGDAVDLYAPGKYILSTLPDNNIGMMSGTSTSSAIVAGVAGLVWGTNSNLESEDIRDILIQTSRWTTVEENTMNLPEKRPDRSVAIVNAFNSISMADAYEKKKSQTESERNGVFTGLVYSTEKDAKDVSPIRNVVVTATDPYGKSVRVKSEDAFNFAVPLEPGEYSVLIHKSGYKDVKIPLEIQEGQFVCIDVKMEKAQ